MDEFANSGDHKTCVREFVAFPSGPSQMTGQCLEHLERVPSFVGYPRYPFFMWNSIKESLSNPIPMIPAEMFFWLGSRSLTASRRRRAPKQRANLWSLWRLWRSSGFASIWRVSAFLFSHKSPIDVYILRHREPVFFHVWAHFKHIPVIQEIQQFQEIAKIEDEMNGRSEGAIKERIPWCRVCGSHPSFRKSSESSNSSNF